MTPYNNILSSHPNMLRRYIKSISFRTHKGEILPNDKLQAISAGKTKMSMFKMNKLLAQHLS
jgi:chromatin remodeling complex protein RSC6